jgi:hypothetical protein
MLAANPRTNRKDLAGKLLVDVKPEEMEARKLSLASDLHWLISEGYVVEFNDGSLDLPRAKAPKPANEKAAESAGQPKTDDVVAAVDAMPPGDLTGSGGGNLSAAAEAAESKD